MTTPVVPVSPSHRHFHNCTRHVFPPAGSRLLTNCANYTSPTVALNHNCSESLITSVNIQKFTPSVHHTFISSGSSRRLSHRRSPRYHNSPRNPPTRVVRSKQHELVNALKCRTACITNCAFVSLETPASTVECIVCNPRRTPWRTANSPQLSCPLRHNGNHRCL